MGKRHIPTIKERGDTIIEVLMAMTIIGLTFAIGFNIANNGLQTGRAATERGEALKIAETQVEVLKASLSDDVVDDFEVSTPYCVLTLNTREQNPASVPGSNCNNLNGSFYNVRLDYNAPSGGDPASYRSSVTWDAPNSEVPAVVELFYRPYDEN